MDFEAFKSGNEDYILKELCLLNVDKPLMPLYFVFSSPQPWDKLDATSRKHYRYQSKHIHGLEWSEGVSRYCRNCVMHHIKMAYPLCTAGIIYVMGLDKMTFLTSEFPELNFAEYHVTFNQLPPLTKNIMCYHRDHGEHCAFRKCMRLYQHYICLPIL